MPAALLVLWIIRTAVNSEMSFYFLDLLFIGIETTDQQHAYQLMQLMCSCS